jgi:acetyl-CoA synthetase
VTGTVWEPTPDVLARSQLTRLVERLGVSGYDELYRLSVAQPALFWSATLELLDVRWDTPYEEFVSFERGAAAPQWFAGGRLNAAKLVLRPERAADVALVSEDEGGAVRVVTYGELADSAARLAGGLRAQGIREGDRVGLFLTMNADAVVALLAVASLGAVAVPLFSGFGAAAAASRLSLADATCLVAVESFVRRGREIDVLSVVDELRTGTPGLRTIVVRRTSPRPLPSWARDWDDLGGERTEPVSLPAEAPLMILFTSGTTGKPKGVVHTHSGFPLKVIQDSAHVFDVRAGDRLFWPSDLGWVLGAITIYGVLGLRGSLVLYDGALDVPTAERYASLAERHDATHLGASPTLIRTLAASLPSLRAAWPRLRVLTAAGEVLDPEHFAWFQRAFGAGRLPLVNYSGGTEVSGGLVANVLHRPISASRFNSAVPGVALDVFDEAGRPVRDRPGELVVLRPCVGMAAGFWAAPEQFRETYWRRFPGVWAHGDLAEADDAGSFRILGRADDTLKIAGKRTGPAEIESVVLEHEAVSEAAAIGIPDPIKGEALILLVVGSASEDELGGLIGERLGRPFVPHRVHRVAELPRTRTGKTMRRLVRSAYLGVEPLGDTSALENPSALDAVRACGGYPRPAGLASSPESSSSA